MDVTDYGNGWIGYAPMGPPLPREQRPRPIATWQARLPGKVSSSLDFADSITRADLVATLNQRPEYMPFIWPDRELRSDADLRTLALLKILALVSFAAGWATRDPADLAAPATGERLDLTSHPAPWVRATGVIFADGDTNAGFEDLTDHAGDPAIDITGGRDDQFLAALAGAELFRLIRAELASWDPFSDSPMDSRYGDSPLAGGLPD